MMHPMMHPTDETRNLPPRLRKAIVAAIEEAMNEYDRGRGYEPSVFHGQDAAEEVWIWEQGGESSWVDLALYRNAART